MRTGMCAVLLGAVACTPGHAPAPTAAPSSTPVVTQSATPSRTPTPTGTVLPEPTVLTSVTRTGGDAAFRWTAQYPALHGLAPAAAVRADAGLAAFVDARIRADRRLQRSDPKYSVTDDLTVEVVANDDRYLTVVVSVRYYPAGAAHPALDEQPYVVHRADGRHLTLRSFVRVGRLSPVLGATSAYARRRFPTLLGDSPYFVETRRDGTRPTYANFERVTPLPEGMQVTFGTYQVASFAEGFPVVVVPWSSFFTSLALPPPGGDRDPAYREGRRPYPPERSGIVKAVVAARAGTYRLTRVQIALLDTSDPAKWAMATLVPGGVVALHTTDYGDTWTVVPCATMPAPERGEPRRQTAKRMFMTSPSATT